MGRRKEEEKAPFSSNLIYRSL